MSRNKREGRYAGKLEGKHYRQHRNYTEWANGPCWLDAMLVHAVRGS